MRNKKLTIGLISLVVISIASVGLAFAPKATLINDQGDKAVVLSGSAEAQRYFASGYVLMGAAKGNSCECSVLGGSTASAFTAADLISNDDLTVSDDATIGDDLAVTGDLSITGTLAGDAKTASIAATSIYATTTLVAANSGTTYLISASGTTITLPAVSNTGAWFRFIIAAAIDTASTTITSAAGDDIEGSIIVAGAIVDCNAADVITIDAGNENIGDFVTLISTGTYWIPLESGFKTAAVNTCSG